MKRFRIFPGRRQCPGSAFQSGSVYCYSSNDGEKRPKVSACSDTLGTGSRSVNASGTDEALGTVSSIDHVRESFYYGIGEEI